jgi:hypothetical protein
LLCSELFHEADRMSGDGASNQVRDFFVRATGRSMSLIELIAIVFIMAALAAGAGPIYRSYTLDAKTAEAKVLAGSLWTAVSAKALTACGTSMTVASSYSKAGLDVRGASVPPRWTVAAGGANPVTADCDTGAISPGGDLFEIHGVADDVASIRVKLHHAAGDTPPSRLRCSVDAGTSFLDC